MSVGVPEPRWSVLMTWRDVSPEGRPRRRFDSVPNVDRWMAELVAADVATVAEWAGHPVERLLIVSAVEDNAMSGAGETTAAVKVSEQA